MPVKIHADIVSAEKEIFSGLVECISVSGVLGDLGIYHGHTPLLTILKPGHITVTLEGQNKKLFYVSGGILEVQHNCITILADSAEHAENLNHDAVLAAKDAAQQALLNYSGKSGDGIDYDKVSEDLAKASAQLRLISNLNKSKQHN